MWKWVVRALAVLGALTVVFFVFAVMGFGLMATTQKTARLPRQIVLETQLHRGVVERADTGFFSGFGPRPQSVREIVLGLERAADDSRVVALVSDLSHLSAGLAQLQEIREAVLAFRKSGKRAIAFADTFGELTPADGAYYLASAYDEIHIQPSGGVGLTGLSVEAPFARGFFDKLGVTADFRQRHEYKSAPETFTRTDFSGPAREATEALLTSEFSQIVRGIAQTRGISEEQIRGWVNQAPLSATQALEAKLIDGISYRDEVYEKVFSGKHTEAKPLFLSAYLKRLSAPRHRPTVALIFGTGQVERSSAESSEFDDDDTMRSGKLAAQFRKAADDEDVKAIVFRVDSPGGSYIASDTIRREVANARKKGKPVIVSMGNVAASGGYFVAMDADKVVANPGTITGSIGVFAGKFITRDLWAKLGVNFSTLSRGEMSTFWSSDQPFTPLQSKRLDAWLDFVYDDFTKKAAAGRQMPLEKVLEVAKGRVWTGEDAQRLGLVDVLGGLLTARGLATEAAGLAGQAVDLVVYPDERPAFERVLQVLAGDGAESSEEEGEVDTRLLSMRGFQRWGMSWVRRTMGLHARGPLHSDVPEVRW